MGREKKTYPFLVNFFVEPLGKGCVLEREQKLKAERLFNRTLFNAVSNRVNGKNHINS